MVDVSPYFIVPAETPPLKRVQYSLSAALNKIPFDSEVYRWIDEEAKPSIRDLLSEDLEERVEGLRQLIEIAKGANNLQRRFRELTKTSQDLVELQTAFGCCGNIVDVILVLDNYLDIFCGPDNNAPDISKRIGLNATHLRYVLGAMKQHSGAKPEETDKISIMQLGEFIKEISESQSRLNLLVNNTINGGTDPSQVYLSPDFYVALFALYSNAKNAVPRRGGKVHIKFSYNKGVLRAQVKDNGEGIDPLRAPRIFERGYSTQRLNYGEGLSTAAKIAHGYKGEIKCISSHRKGSVAISSKDPHKAKTLALSGRRNNTTFTLEIPMHRSNGIVVPERYNSS